MPVQIAVTQGERSLAELAKRLYHISGTGAVARAREAENALLRANPQLRDFHNLPSRAPILVPEVTGASTTAQPTPIATDAQELVKQLLRSLVSIQQSFADAASREDAAEEQLAQTLKSSNRQLTKLAQEFPEVRQHLDQIKENSKLHRIDVAARKKRAKQGLGEIEKDLEGFLANQFLRPA